MRRVLELGAVKPVTLTKPVRLSRSIGHEGRVACLLPTLALISLPNAAMAQTDTSVNGVGLLLAVLFWLAAIVGIVWIALLPTIIAFRRRHPHRWLILVINLLFSATGIGWIIALIWALNSLPFTDDFHGRLGTVRVETREPLLVAQTAQPTRSPAEDAADQLQRLKQLHSQGALTDEEYARARRPLLDRLMG